MFSADINSRRKGSKSNPLSYTLPKLHTGKNWYVAFTCYDPTDGCMKRKKFMLDSIAKVSDRKKRAAVLITQLTARLTSG